MEPILGKKDTFLERWGELGENWKQLGRRRKRTYQRNWGELTVNY